MSDTNSDAISHHGLSDSESEGPGKSLVDSANQRLGVIVCPLSVNPIQSQTPFVVGSTSSTRSAHYKGNQKGHVLLEEAESYKGEKFMETPTLTTPQKNTPLNLWCHRGWAMGKEKGLRPEGWKSLHWCLKLDCLNLWEKLQHLPPGFLLTEKTHPNFVDSTHESPYASRIDCMPASDSPGQDSSLKDML